MMWLIAFSVTLASIGAIAGWYFVWLYVHEAWRETEAGRHLMHFTAGMAVIMTWTVAGILIRVFWPNLPWLEVGLAVGRTIIFGWAAYMLIQRTRLLRRAIRSRRDPEMPTLDARSEPSSIERTGDHV